MVRYSVEENIENKKFLIYIYECSEFEEYLLFSLSQLTMLGSYHVWKYVEYTDI